MTRSKWDNTDSQVAESEGDRGCDEHSILIRPCFPESRRHQASRYMIARCECKCNIVKVTVDIDGPLKGEDYKGLLSQFQYNPLFQRQSC